MNGSSYELELKQNLEYIRRCIMVKKEMVKLALAIAMVLGVLTGTVGAATISVKQLGCGTETQCSTTINGGYALAQDNDTIVVYPGTYNEALVIGKNIALRGAGPQWTTIYGSTHAITINSNFSATISGFTIKSTSGHGILMNSATSAVINNNIIMSNGMNGINAYFTNAYASIFNNIISYNAQDGIYAYGNSTYPTGVTSNIITNNGRYGIYFFNFGGTASSTSYNNVYSNGVSAYYRGFYNNAGSPGPGDITQNPLYIDATTANYVLQVTSPCKNAGSPGSADNDPDGSRNDMGAFGGPGAAAFWPYPQGSPIISSLTASPTSVQKGGTITINATGMVQ
jgi:hypothetical protein